MRRRFQDNPLHFRKMDWLMNPQRNALRSYTNEVYQDWAQKFKWNKEDDSVSVSFSLKKDHVCWRQRLQLQQLYDNYYNNDNNEYIFFVD